MRSLFQKPIVCGIVAFLLGLAVMLPLFSAEMPAAAQSVLDKATADIAKVRVALVTALTKAQEVATKKGDLDGAMAIKEEIAKQTAAVEAAADLLGGGKVGAATGGSGIRVKGDGEPDVMWDNQSTLPLSTASHTLTFFLRLPKPYKQVWIKAKQGYGSERVILNIEGRSENKMAREYTATFPTAKEIVKITGEHRGSNDAFSYGPLQYKLEADGDWTDIPASALAPGK